MGLYLRKNHKLRCWGCPSSLNWIGALTFPLLLKLPGPISERKTIGNGRFVKKCPFQKIYFFLIWIKSVKNNFWLGGIQPSPALLHYPSALLANQGALLLKGKKTCSKSNFDLIIFILNKQFLHFWRILLDEVWHIVKYIL